MSTQHPKINPECRDEKMFLQAASLCTNLQNNRGLCKFGGLTSDKELQKICSTCNLFFSIKVILGAHLFPFFLPYFCTCSLQYFLFLLHYSKFYFLPYKPIWCFIKTWCHLVLLYFLINRIPFYYIISDASQTSFDENNLYLQC